MKQLHAISLLVSLVLSALLGVSVTQTLSDPLDALSTAIWGHNVYLYNPATQSIVSPTGSGNGLIMIPWQYYDNTTMQWQITQYTSSPLTFYISAVNPTAAGCPTGTVAHWNAPKKSPVTTLCSTSSSVYTNFLVLAGAANLNFLLSPNSNAAACVAVVNDVPTSPATVCNPLGQYAQWQLVTISSS